MTNFTFNGFHKETLNFYKNLANNNNKEWFSEHKIDYEEFVMRPARKFIIEMGKRLHTISSDIYAIPKTDKSIFRIYRDIRFSPNKTPYKTHLGIFFWEGNRKKLECPGFYLQIEKDKLYIGVGLYIFQKDIKENFRNAVIDEKKGNELVKIINKLKKQKYELGGKHYKKIPQGFDGEHKNAEYLLYNGFWAGLEFPIIEEFFSKEFVDWCFEHFMKMIDLHNWMLKLI